MIVFWWVFGCIYAFLALGNFIIGEFSFALNDFVVTALIANIIIREKTIKKLGG